MRTLTSISTVLAILASLLLQGCILGDDEGIVSGMGTITFLDFEGGFYGIEADNGDHFDPVNLEPEFQVDGLRVKFRGRIIEGASTHMWGRLLELKMIKRLE
ncbi:MAG: hypothetical protein JSW58_15175 [Candidatus Latescibacterota bacterium]|nr:MAG: hypothetical protein JSW58_15175 [Candidatus Latescibacterota bacterium]